MSLDQRQYSCREHTKLDQATAYYPVVSLSLIEVQLYPYYLGSLEKM